MTQEFAAEDSSELEPSGLLALIRRHRLFAGGALAAVLLSLTVVASFAPWTAGWLDAHPQWRLAFLVGLIALVLLGWVYLAMDKRVTQLEETNDQLRDANARLAAEVSQAQRPGLVPHDRTLFKEWLRALPGGEGVRTTLRSFFPRKWSMDLQREIEDFLERWADRGFVDPELDAGYTEFYSALSALDHWMGDQSYSLNDLTVYVPKPDSEDLLPGFYETLQEGTTLAQSAADQAAEFEKLGHRRGL